MKGAVRIQCQFFPYFGGKRRHARLYPPPRFDTIVEPFAGGAGYSTTYHDREVVLVDAYRPVSDAWGYLTSASRSDVLGLPLLSPGQRLSSLTLSDGERALIGFWLARGSSTPRDRMVPSWSERYPDRFWGEHVRSRIADQVELIRHWRVVLGDYRSPVVDGPATWFVDPPYRRAGRSYPMHDIDYRALAEWCRSRTGQTIVCEESGEDWLPFRPLYSHRGISREIKGEAVWLSE